MPARVLFYVTQHGTVPGKLRHALPNTPDADLGELAYGSDSPVVLFGHSHVQFQRTVDNQTFINPGSVGQPRDGVAKTAFGVLDLKHWRFTWVRLDYDFEATGQRIRDAGLDAAMATRLTRGK